MKKLFKILYIFILASCSNQYSEIPDNAKIIAKYIVHDEKSSPNLSNCSNEKNDFLHIKKYDCSFIMDNYEFDIEDKYVFNDHGEFIEFWNYLAEGPVVTKIEDLKKDSNYLSSIGGKKINAKWGKDKKIIIIGEDSLTIEQIFPKYKLIWITQDFKAKKNDRRILIEYN